MSAQVVICGGGTGGHITPGLAVAAELRKLGIAVAWLGTQGGMEENLIPKQDIELRTVRYAAPTGGKFGYFKSMLRLLPAALAAKRHLTELDARLVLGMGGYPSLPGMIAGYLRRIRRLIHEQNVIPGLANRMLAPLVHEIITSYPATFTNRSPKLVGNPVRLQFVDCIDPTKRFAKRDGPLRLLVIGGSRGAVSLNTGVPKALAQTRTHWQTNHLAGKENVAATQQAYADAKLQATVFAYTDDIADKMLDADLIICRGGASTIAEVAAVGVAAVIVPYPYAAAHQKRNAQVLVEAGAAAMIVDSELGDAENLVKVLDRLSARETLKEMASKAYQTAKPQAAAHVAQACQRELTNAA